MSTRETYRGWPPYRITLANQGIVRPTYEISKIKGRLNELERLQRQISQSMAQTSALKVALRVR